MHDIRPIRDDTAGFDAALARRGMAPQAGALIAIDERRRATIAEAQAAQTERNALSKEIGAAKAARDEARASELMARVAALKERLPALEAEEARIGGELDALLATLPNLPAADVPDGADEDDNVLVHQRGTPRVFGQAPREHDAIGPALGLDFEGGVAVAGARFTLLRGPAARLNLASVRSFSIRRVAVAAQPLPVTLPPVTLPIVGPIAPPTTTPTVPLPVTEACDGHPGVKRVR